MQTVMHSEEKTLAELVDWRENLDTAKEKILNLMAEVDHEIMSRMLQAGEKQALGSNGTGYTVTSTTRYEFTAQAYRVLEEKGLLDHFRAEPKISKAKLESLQKEGILDPADYAEVWKHAIPDQSPYSLKRYVPKAAKVFA